MDFGEFLHGFASFWRRLFDPSHREDADLQLPVPDPHATGSSSSSTTFTGVPTGYEYEVFLSFRGPDTRTHFTDHLYHVLKGAGIRVFRDDEDLRKGEEIKGELLEAIKQSKISIPIFSKGYASSKWCLREAAQMVKCMETTKQLILPVFYYVTPNQVRHQTGDYASAFSTLKNEEPPKIVKEWRSALSKIGKLSGWHLTSCSFQGALVQEICSEVLQQLDKFHRARGDNLVGIEDHVDEIMELLDIEIQDVRIVGIWGMGGVGKTTVAKFVYDQLKDLFKYHSFLADIRDKSQQGNGMEYLQGMLLSDILQHHPQEQIAHIDKGRYILNDRLCNKRVLILLDDVDHSIQLSNLLPCLHCFEPGSRIIITTRGRDVLMNLQFKRIYEFTGMNQENALVLFCKRAFRQNSPYPKFADLSREIIKATEGLPLAIELIGTYLSTRLEMEIWRETLDRLIEKEPRIEKRLMISIDTLRTNEREIFLDMACLFNGMDFRALVCMWSACRLSPARAIEDLQRRSLIKIGGDNVVRMHNLLRDLGREIVHNENNRDPGERSRLWQHKDAVRVLRTGTGTSKVIAIRLDCGQIEGVEDWKFKKLTNLTFLDLGDANLQGNFGKHLWTLKWLSMHGNAVSIPNHLEDLVVLDLSKSAVTCDWIGWSTVQVLQKLEVVNLTGCHYLTGSPQFNSFPPIKRLILDDCQALCEVDPSIGNLKSLESISLKNCCNLKRLPKELGHLSSLIELVIDGTLVKEISVSSAMSSLRILSAKWCRSLSGIPDSIGCLKRLQRLLLNHCTSLQEIPASVGELELLKELDVSHTSVSCLPGSVGNLINLELLDVSHSPASELPRSLNKLQKLEVLNASNCQSLGGTVPLTQESAASLRILRIEETKIVEIPSCIQQQTRLQTLDLKSCKHLQTLPHLPVCLVNLKVTCHGPMPALLHLPKLVHLKQLDILECEMLTALPVEIRNLPLLRELSIVDCRQLEYLPQLPSGLRFLQFSGLPLLDGLPDLSDLRKLLRFTLLNCSRVLEVPGLKHMVSLRKIRISSTPLADLNGLEHLSSLSYLSIDKCEFKMLPDLSGLKGIQDMTVKQCTELIEIRGLGILESLTTLSISGCTSLGALPGDLHSESQHILNFSNLQMLKSLELEGLGFVRAIHLFNQLEILEISGCDALQEILLPDPYKLKQLKLKRCRQIVKIPLAHWTSLEMLDLSECGELIAPLLSDPSSKLKQLKIQHCNQLEEISLTHLSSLEMLDVSECGELRMLSLPDASSKLKQLNVKDCKRLAIISKHANLTSLNKLTVSNCDALEKLPYLLRELQQLELRNCTNLREIPPLKELSSLQMVEIVNCGVSYIPDISSLPQLKHLKLHDCRRLQQIGALKNLASLEVLEMVSCINLPRSPDLSSLNNLNILNAEYCIDLSEIQGLGDLVSLVELNLSDCSSLEKLEDLSNLQTLRILRLSSCSGIKEICGLQRLVSLENLNLYGCSGMELLDLSLLCNLKILSVSSCKNLSEILGLSALVSLEELDLPSCSALKELPDVSNLQKLRTLNMFDCKGLVEIHGKLVSLEYLNLLGCNALKELPRVSKMKIKEISLPPHLTKRKHS